MEKTLIILRGLPSSGKTTFAKMLVQAHWCENTSGPSADIESRSVMFAADDYFANREFDHRALGAAHEQCRVNVSNAMAEAVPLIIVHNTNVKASEVAPYVRLAEDNRYRYFVLSLGDGGLTDEELAARNTHGVPQRTMTNMRRKFQFDM